MSHEQERITDRRTCEEHSWETRKYSRPMKTGCSQSNAQRAIYDCRLLDYKKERFQVNNLTFHLKKLEQEKQTQPKTHRGRNSYRLEGDK